MSIRMETLEIGHRFHDERGQKVEPEAQPALQRGFADVMVNAGVENPNGGPPIITIPDVAAYVAQNGGFKGISRLAKPVVERHTTAGAVASELTRKCFHCRSFDLDAIQSSKNLQRDRNNVELVNGYVRKGYSLPMARATAETVGLCGQYDMPTEALNSCPYFRPRSRLTRILLDRKFTQIMRAAQGKLDQIDLTTPGL